jgi:TolA-binding protein
MKKARCSLAADSAVGGTAADAATSIQAARVTRSHMHQKNAIDIFLRASVNQHTPRIGRMQRELCYNNHRHQHQNQNHQHQNQNQNQNQNHHNNENHLLLQ